MSEPGFDLITGDRARDGRNVSILLESVGDLYGTLRMDELQRRIVGRALHLTGAERGLLLLESAGGALRIAVALSASGFDLPTPVAYSTTAVGLVRRQRRHLRMLSPQDESARDLGASVESLRLLSIMAFPIAVQGRLLGVLYVDSTRQSKEFNDAELAVFSALGGLAALAIERVEKERMARDIAAARSIQRDLLPRALAGPEGFDLAADERPCDETSGDYYDVIPVAGGRVALVMGDVSGHGLPAALLMACTRSMLHVLLASCSEPSEVLGALNAFLQRDLPAGRFVSLFLGILHPAARQLTYVNGGHCAPLLVRADGGLHRLSGTGAMLGILEQAAYGRGDPVTLAPGDAVMLYTDGVTEARDAKGEMYGLARLRTSLGRHAPKATGAAGLLAAVLADADAFTAGRAADDDRTCLVLRAQ